jgi:superfamily II DNA/RNA helicase
MKFTELDLDEQLLEAIHYMGFEDATPIQAESIPIILDHHDLLACAQTGTGKTVAFVLPVLNKLVGKQDYSTDTLIIVPTRELAIQIEQQIQGLSYFVSANSMTVYGGGDGKDWNEQKDALKNGCDIIVATPGKLLSHLKQGYVDFDHLQHLILDEADRMLDMGFVDDIQKIISYIPNKHQTLMFSATMPSGIAKLAKKILTDPKEISLAISKPAEGVDQKTILCYDEQKAKIIRHIIKERPDYDSILIFTSTKSKVGEIVQSLRKGGLPAKGISSNLLQNEREEVLRGFRSKQIRILVATDVLSRGIDIKDISLVINYDTPQDAEDYVHRVGRTARAASKGEAITLVNQKDMPRMHRIERLIEMNIDKLQPPEEIGEGPKWKKPRPKNQNKSRYRKNYRKPKSKSNKAKTHKPKR